MIGAVTRHRLERVLEIVRRPDAERLDQDTKRLGRTIDLPITERHRESMSRYPAKTGQ